MNTELIVLKTKIVPSFPFLHSKEESLHLHPKTNTRQLQTTISRRRERNAESVLHSHREEIVCTHIPDSSKGKSNWSSFLDKHHYKSRDMSIMDTKNKQHYYCIPSSANSRSTKFNSRIFKSFCVM